MYVCVLCVHVCGVDVYMCMVYVYGMCTCVYVYLCICVHGVCMYICMWYMPVQPTAPHCLARAFLWPLATAAFSQRLCVAADLVGFDVIFHTLSFDLHLFDVFTHTLHSVLGFVCGMCMCV